MGNVFVGDEVSLVELVSQSTQARTEDETDGRLVLCT